MINRKTIVLDAAGQAPGRLGTKIAMILMGKNKPDYVPHIDSGDFVVITNAGKVRFTGKKLDQKVYVHHSGYPGGAKATPAKKMLAEKPENIVRQAVYNMLPKNTLRNDRMKRLSFK